MKSLGSTTTQGTSLKRKEFMPENQLSMQRCPQFNTYTHRRLFKTLTEFEMSLEWVEQHWIQVESLLETKPILWISSSTWFAFLTRRLKVLDQAHSKLWHKLPSNLLEGKLGTTRDSKSC
jgi:hypothetical protein